MSGFLLFFLLFLPLYGTAKPTSKSFLWEVTGEKGSVYLLGSIHAAKQQLFPLKRPIETAYTQSDTIAVEVDLGKASHTLPSLVKRHAFFPGNKRLYDHIRPENHTLLAKYLKEHNLQLDQIETMKPWYLSLLLTNLSMERIGASSYYGIDRYMMGRAERDKKAIIELEGAELQITMLDALPMREQELLLVSSIVEDEHMEESFNGMMKIWSSGDIRAMDSFIRDSLEPYPELQQFNERFLNERNRKMVQKIDGLIKKGGKVLVIVGVAHFLGEEGIIALLQKKGYTVRQR